MSASNDSGVSENLLTPTDSRFASEDTHKELRPYYDQDPFLAAPEGFDAPMHSDARYHAFISGIGAGKTVAGIIRLLLNVYEWNPGKTHYVIAPTVPALRNVIIPELRKWNVLAAAEEWKPSEKTLTFPNGSRVVFESADNERKIERLRGPSIASFWIDEAANISQTAWDIMIGRLRDGDYLNACITTTPKGFNWVFERFHPDGEKYGPDVNAVLEVESTANPHLPEAYADITDEYAGTFHAQEVGGKFVQPEGLVYGAFGRDSHVVDTFPANPDRFIFGVDWGFSNPSAIVAIMLTRTGEAVVCEEFYESRVTVDDLTDVLKDMQRRWKPGPVYCDPSEPANIEQLQRVGIDALGANNDVMSGIQHVTSRLDRFAVHESCQNLVNEFRMYRYDDSADDEQPVKQNDHLLDATRYALFTAHEQGASSLSVVSGDMY